MAPPRCPNFLIIGAPRSGTTYLARNLENHPAISIAKSKDDPFANDLHFFDVNTPKGAENFRKGWSWYLEQFQSLPEDTLAGEKTADYLTDPDAPDLVKEFLPQAKLIAILRNPIDRAQSHFWHSRHRLPSGLTLSELAQGGRDVNGVWVLESGFYARQLRSYLERFGSDQILTLVYEDIKRSPQDTLESVLRFLGVDAKMADFRDAHTKINSGSSSFASQMIAKIGSGLRKLSPRLYHALLHGGLSRLTKSFLQTVRGKRVELTSERAEEKRYPDIDIKTRKALWQLYSDDVRDLSEMIGRDLSAEWAPNND